MQVLLNVAVRPLLHHFSHKCPFVNNPFAYLVRRLHRLSVPAGEGALDAAELALVLGVADGREAERFIRPFVFLFRHTRGKKGQKGIMPSMGTVVTFGSWIAWNVVT